MDVVIIFTIFSWLQKKFSFAYFLKRSAAAHEFHNLIVKRINFIYEVDERPLWRQHFIIKVFLEQMIVHGYKGAKFV
jgi:hypothetical protein